MKITWTKTSENGNTYYTEATGRYRIQRHEVDDTWDTGAIVPLNIQWVREESTGSDWQPVEIHNTLTHAKSAAERWLSR